jgi:hypothetical protein
MMGSPIRIFTIGIASDEEMKARTLAMGRSQLKPTEDALTA